MNSRDFRALWVPLACLVWALAVTLPIEALRPNEPTAVSHYYLPIVLRLWGEPTPAPSTPMPSLTATSSATPTPSDTPTATATFPLSATPTSTSTHTATSTATDSATPTGTATLVPSLTPTSSATPTASATGTPTPSATATATLTPTLSPTPTTTSTPTLEPTRELLFQNGLWPNPAYHGIADTWIDGRNPAQTHGSDISLSVGRWGLDGIRRVLIRVGDLAPHLPPTAEIVSAKLYLRTNGQPHVRLDALQVLRDWSESAATWADASPDEPWALAGCSSHEDREVDAESESTAESTTLWSWDLTAAVQEWVLFPERNKGLLLMNNLIEDETRVFFSSEAAAAENRPYLRVIYREHGGALPVQPTPLVSFATYGDSRISADDAASIQLAMAHEIERRRPDFVMHLGDMVHYGQSLEGWNRLRDELFAPYLALPQPDGLDNCRPLSWYEDPSVVYGACDRGLFAIPGNHEYMNRNSSEFEAANIEPYLAFFSYLPNNGRNYSFDLVGDAFAEAHFSGIHCVALDALPFEMTFDQQVRLLAQDLEGKEDHLILFFVHQTFYSLGRTSGNTGLRNRYLPLLDRYPLALMTFSGDDHSYQRLQPPGHTRTYIIAAGGGAKLYEQEVFPHNWPKAVHIAAYSFAYIQIYPDRIELHAYKVEHSGEIWRMDQDVIPIPASNAP